MSLKDKTVAVIVTYNPEIELLINNLNHLCNQVNEVVICDNASENDTDIGKVAEKYGNVKLINNKSNIGLPINYNRVTRYAVEEGYEWLLIMDQDTIIPDETINNYSESILSSAVAIISPVIYDVNLHSTDDIEAIPKEKNTFIDKCISSASLNRIDAIIEVGGFDEFLFIDYVDFDFCKNCSNHGYQIVRNNDVIVNHRIGNSTIHNLMGAKLRAYNTSPFRKYYYFRNRIYYARKYSLSLREDREYFKSLLASFLVLFFEKQKLKKIHAAIKGLKAGMMKKMV